MGGGSIPLPPPRPHLMGGGSIPLPPPRPHLMGGGSIPLPPPRPHLMGRGSIPLPPPVPVVDSSTHANINYKVANFSNNEQFISVPVPAVPSIQPQAQAPSSSNTGSIMNICDVTCSIQHYILI